LLNALKDDTSVLWVGQKKEPSYDAHRDLPSLSLVGMLEIGIPGKFTEGLTNFVLKDGIFY
jgi:hypothetical protein